MAFLSDYAYDIFISYAHQDNEAPVGEDRWISRFVEDLCLNLCKRLGVPREVLKVFFDERALTGGEQLERMIEIAATSALFIPIVSPSYVNRSFPLRELAAFSALSDAAGRIFAVDILPLDDASKYPNELRERVRTAFWQRAKDSDAPMTVDWIMARERFNWLIVDFAHKVKTKLSDMSGHRNMLVQSMGLRRPTVLLGQVTDDLDAERDRVRSYLEQFEIDVLPASAYPQDGQRFLMAFAADCARADCYAGLLSESAARRPPDLPDGYSIAQYQTAKQLKRRTFLWHRPDLTSASIKHHKDKTLFAAPELQVLGIEEFKKQLVEAAHSGPMPPSGPASPVPSFVFIDSDRADLDLAKELSAEVMQGSYSAILPLFDGGPDEILRDLEDNIVECNALVVVYGNAQPTWVRAQLRLFVKLSKSRRETPPKVLAIYAGPSSKRDVLGVLSPDIKWIDAPAAKEILRALQ
jgi:hypothetical protein